MYSTDQVLCLWNSDRILMGSDKIYNRKSASSVDIHIWSDNKYENRPYTESASHLLLIEHWEIKSFTEWEELIQGLSPSQKVPDRVLEGGFPITRFISYYIKIFFFKFSFKKSILQVSLPIRETMKSLRRESIVAWWRLTMIVQTTCHLSCPPPLRSPS